LALGADGVGVDTVKKALPANAVNGQTPYGVCLTILSAGHKNREGASMKARHGLFIGFVVLMLTAAFILAGCGDSGNPTGTGGPELTGTITISPNASVTVGTQLTANYNGIETVTYQWKRGSTNVGSGSTYTPDQAGSYTITVSASGFKSKISDPVIVTLGAGGPELTGTITISPNASVTVGTQLTANYSGIETVTYQWKRDSANVGAGSTYTPDQAGSYTVIVSAAGYQSKTSAAVNVSASTSPVITITTQPANRTVREGNISSSLTVEATVTEGATPAYQWHSNTGNSNIGGTVISGAVYETFYIPTSLTEGTYYYFCEVTAAGADSVISDVATVTVNPVPQGDVHTISLTGFPSIYNYNYVTITLYSNANASSLTGSNPSYSEPAAYTDGTFSYGSAMYRPLYTSLNSSGKPVDLPAAGSYYITIQVERSGWWGSTRKLGIADPIEYSEVFRWHQRP
jgi:GH24 family phage-related lysozyme (muramidase)